MVHDLTFLCCSIFWPGIYHLFKEKIQILWATALLGMGFQTLGLEHDFFHGLML